MSNSPTVVLNLPGWLYNLLVVSYHNWLVALSVLLGGTLLMVVVYFINRHFTKKQQQALESKTLHLLLAGIAVLFGFLGQVVPFLHDNLAVFRNIPHVGEYVVSIYGAANFLYALKGKKWLQAFTAWASKETATPYGGATEAAAPLSQPAVATDPDALS